MSPRLSPQELQEAKQRKKEEAAAAQQREQAAAATAREQAATAAAQKQIEAAAAKRLADERRQRLEEQLEQFFLLDSVSLALYTEMGKLAAKAPKETLTPLSLEKVNAAIRDVKAFMPDDPNLTDVTIFVPAGNMPEYRDVVLILSLLRAALDRFDQSHRTEIGHRRLR